VNKHMIVLVQSKCIQKERSRVRSDIQSLHADVING